MISINHNKMPFIFFALWLLHKAVFYLHQIFLERKIFFYYVLQGLLCKKIINIQCGRYRKNPKKSLFMKG